MAHAWSNADTQALAATPQQQVQLSDGTLIFLIRVSATLLDLRYWNGTSSVLIRQLAIGTTGAAFQNTGSYGLCRDSSDNLYVAAPNGLTNWRFRAFAKGAGLTWTAANEQTTTLSQSPGPGLAWLTWCDTGGGTGGAGHLFGVVSEAGGPYYVITDAGALLNSNIGGAEDGVTPTFAGAADARPHFLCPDGFGAATGIYVAATGSGSSTVVGAWGVSALGTLTTSTLISNAVAGLRPAGSAPCPPFPVRVAANVFALVGVPTATVNAGVLAVARYSKTAALTAATTRALSDNAAFTTAGQLAVGVGLDWASRLWVFYRDSAVGTTVRRIGASVLTGVTWDAGSTVADTNVGSAGTDVVFGNLQEFPNPASEDILWVNAAASTVYDDDVAFLFGRSVAVSGPAQAAQRASRW